MLLPPALVGGPRPKEEMHHGPLFSFGRRCFCYTFCLAFHPGGNMDKQLKRAAFFAALLAAVIAVAPAVGNAQSEPIKPPKGRAKTSEDTFKNIQVLKEIPEDRLILAMQFMTASLGVGCDFCHVEGAFEKEDKKPKQTARKMMLMMFAINKDHFEGRREVTCYSCHRGMPHPVAIPVIGEEAPNHGPEERHEGNAATPSDLPAADQIVDKYVQALGGAAALQKISSRVEKGTASFDSLKVAVEVFLKAPAKRASVMHLPGGDSVTAFDGESGWLGLPGHLVREMTSADLEAARLDADLYLPLHLKQIFSGLSVERSEKVNDRVTYVVSGLRQDSPPVRFYFDEQSGLLVRILRFADSPLGLNPTQIDYGDYRDAGGVKTPFKWTIGRPGGRFTIQVDQTQENVAVDDAKFTRPPGPEPKPPEQ